MDSDSEDDRQEKRTRDSDGNAKDKNRQMVAEEQKQKAPENEKDSGQEDTQTGTSEYIGCIKTTVHSIPPALNALTVDTTDDTGAMPSDSSPPKSSTKRESEDNRSESSKSAGGRRTSTARQTPTKGKAEEELGSMEKRKPQETSVTQAGYKSKSSPKVQQSSSKKESTVARSAVNGRSSVASRSSKKAVVRRRIPVRQVRSKPKEKPVMPLIFLTQTEDKTDKPEDDTFLKPSQRPDARDSACEECGCTCFSPTTPRPCEYCGCYCRMLHISFSKERIAQ